MTRSRTSRPGAARPRIAVTALVGAFFLVALAAPSQARAAESDADRRARIAAMSSQDKQQLAQKKVRFDELDADVQKRLRTVHEAIANQPNAEQLERTLVNFYQWLGTLRARERDEVVNPRMAPDERIARIRELLKQQEEERFRKYVGVLPDEDREVLNRWLADFLVRHEEEILELMPRDHRGRYRRSDDEDARLGQLSFWWTWHYSRRNDDAPTPTSEDMKRLIADLSAETQRQINQAPPEEREQRGRDLVRALAFSRFRPPVQREELLKFYDAMKRDDPRRERLEGLTGEELYRELTRMHHEEPWRQRGGPAVGWQQRGGPGGPRRGPPPDAFGQPGPPPVRDGGGRGRRGEGPDRPGERPRDDAPQREENREDRPTTPPAAEQPLPSEVEPATGADDD
jgi:hypothetical protein